MNRSTILALRLFNTGLSCTPFRTAADAVSHLGAVQAQDFAAAIWALGLRVRDSADEAIEAAFDRGSILRTHVMRPTWHFVTPENIRWMLALTAPRVKARLSPYDRRLGLDDALYAKSNTAIVKALHESSSLTRRELKMALAGAGIDTDVQRLGHILMRAELDGLICSGARRGKQFTYALVEDRVPDASIPSRDESLARLAFAYFSSHGPAQLKDFAWWSGLGAKDAKSALDHIASKVRQETLDGKTYWYVRAPRDPIPDPPPALLLSIYDEYTIAYKDRGDISEVRDIERMISMGNALTAVIVLNGGVAGTWNRGFTKNVIEIRLNLFRRADGDEQEALERAAERYGKFFGMPAVIVDNP